MGYTPPPAPPKRCARCRARPALTSHAYCAKCRSDYEGERREPLTDRRFDGLCPRCKIMPRARGQSYCRECRKD